MLKTLLFFLSFLVLTSCYETDVDINSLPFEKNGTGIYSMNMYIPVGPTSPMYFGGNGVFIGNTMPTSGGIKFPSGTCLEKVEVEKLSGDAGGNYSVYYQSSLVNDSTAISSFAIPVNIGLTDVRYFNDTRVDNGEVFVELTSLGVTAAGYLNIRFFLNNCK